MITFLGIAAIITAVGVAVKQVVLATKGKDSKVAKGNQPGKG